MVKRATENIITPAVLNAAQIDNTAVANNSISTAKLQDDAVTQDKLANDIDVSHLINDAGYISDLTGFTTDDVTEGSNLYYTDARADGRISAASLFDLNDVLGTAAAGHIPIHDGNDFDVRAVTTSDIGEGTNQYFTTTRAVDAVEGETELTLADDVLVGVSDLRNNTALATKGLHITIDDTITDKWAGIILEEIGQKQFSLNNPLISGQVSGGTAASPTALPSGRRVLNLTASARWGTGTSDFDTIAQVKLITNEQQSATARGGSIVLEINPNGGTINTTEAVKVDADVSGTTQTRILMDPNGDHSKSVISSQSTNGIEIDTQVIVLSNLPITDPGNPGQLWNDGGTLKVS